MENTEKNEIALTKYRNLVINTNSYTEPVARWKVGGCYWTTKDVFPAQRDCTEHYSCMHALFLHTSTLGTSY